MVPSYFSGRCGQNFWGHTTARNAGVRARHLGPKGSEGTCAPCCGCGGALPASSRRCRSRERSMASRASSPARRSLMESRRSWGCPLFRCLRGGGCTSRPCSRPRAGAGDTRECPVSRSEPSGRGREWRESSCPSRPAATKCATSHRHWSWASGGAPTSGGLRRSPLAEHPLMAPVPRGNSTLAVHDYHVAGATWPPARSS